MYLSIILQDQILAIIKVINLDYRMRFISVLFLKSVNASIQVVLDCSAIEIPYIVELKTNNNLTIIEAFSSLSYTLYTYNLSILLTMYFTGLNFNHFVEVMPYRFGLWNEIDLCFILKVIESYTCRLLLQYCRAHLYSSIENNDILTFLKKFPWIKTFLCFSQFL